MATMRSTEFEEAMKAFTTGLSPEEARDFKYANVQDLEAAIVKIREKQRSDRKLRFLKRLDPIIKTLRQYGQVIEIFVNVSNVVAFVWGPVKLLLEISSTFLEAFDKVLDAYKEIGESMPQVLQYQQLFYESPHMRTILVLIYQDLLEFHKEALRYFRSKVWKKLFQATWRGFVSKIDTIVANMKRHQSLLDSGATIVQFEQIQIVRKEAEQNFKATRQAEMDRKYSAVSQWLAAASSQDIHNQCVEARSSCLGSGRWILSNSKFNKWMHPVFCETPALWLNGSPGVGKSVVASVVIEEINGFNNTNVAYFYCRYEDLERNTFVAVVKGVLSQLFTLNDDIVSYLYEKSSKSGETALASGKLARELLDTVLGFCQKTYIVIDGLDECGREDRKEIALYFRNVVKSLPTTEADRIRCLFISQDDGYARRDLSMLPTLKITEKENKDDIAQFVKVWDEKIRDRFGFEEGLHDISKLITNASQGMFLFARLLVHHLYSQSSLKDLEMELRPDIFPKELNEAYDRILKRIFDGSVASQRKASRTVLGWLVCARRRMKWREIQGAISVDLDESTVELTRRFIDDSKDLAASLVELHPDGSVELVHSSAKKYLTEHGYVDRKKVDYKLALLCLGYLNLPFLRLSEIEAAEQEHLYIMLDGYYAFLDYASVYWISHLEAGIPPSGDTDEVDSLARAVGNFLGYHFRATESKLPVSKTLGRKLDVFKHEPYLERLLQAAVFAKKQLGPFGKGYSDDDPLTLYPLVSRIRKMFEDSNLASQDAHRMKLTELYGPNWFRCTRMNCKYFYEGFNTANLKDQHIARHERAFFCLFGDCPHADLGFVTAKELEKHLHDDHDIMNTDDTEFPSATNHHKTQSKGTGTIPCPHCDQMFTRQYNMRSHVRERHEQGAKLTCPDCSQNFTRPYDLERHSRTHSGAKVHACGGTLKNGDPWGCGLKFSRPDHVKQHHQSETGRRCLQAKIDEETQEQEAMKQELVRLEKAAKTVLNDHQRSKDDPDDQWSDSEDMVKYRELARKHAEIMKKIQEDSNCRQGPEGLVEESVPGLSIPPAPKRSSKMYWPGKSSGDESS